MQTSGKQSTSAVAEASKEKSKHLQTKLHSGYLRDIMWRNKYISTNSNVRINKVLVRSVMTITIEIKNLLRSTEMRAIKSIADQDLIRDKNCKINKTSFLTKKKMELMA